MKVAKFIYPMFLVAIGLHGLLLFLPVGDASEAESTEEIEALDVDDSISAEVLAAKTPATSEAPMGPLPVPSLNVATGGTLAKTPGGSLTSGAAAARTARSAVASVPSAGTLRAAPTRPAPTTSRGTASAATPAASNNLATGAAYGSIIGTSESTNAQAPGGNSANNGGLATSTPGSSSEASTSSASDNADANSSGTDTNTATNSDAGFAGLIASASGRVLDGLKLLSHEFSEDYTYSEQRTDVEGLDERRSRWIEHIGQQASTGLLSRLGGDRSSNETLEPIFLSPAELAYPIEVSAQKDWRAAQLCLDEPQPNDAEVAVLFDFQGNVVGEPEITRSSGYPVIDNEIIAMAKAGRKFPEDSRSKAYVLAFEIEYSAEQCVSLPKLKK